ncbi:pyridoxamine 5'-phosphate oxidase family protein [Telluria mixta]|uniref:Pyridoxamine 5'-phosphate oxidase family protein n=1 Tax=Telluria mixta TaxID=34071 RepID=A0ABT2C367_9BURK|nr:MSMEG_1061 family FMN-dependent PPOX-type flavoprotein [Telluria mixta]MCS0631824.1 pyridoxamine 5'-phosphate oxidase family protein [Telluria mixta]WEM95489.1 pyridoxamine 5'-phosphate oxidase family protein [Telluria mixta]
MSRPDLDTLYDPPAERIQKAVLDRLIDFHRDYLRVATFFCLATGSERGLDASPRGGPPGFVHALDDHHVAFADWPGNNRIESLRNLERDERAGMLFLFPGLEIFMRINGRARATTDDALLARFAEGGKRPKTAIVVTIDEVLFHCGKAVNRAGLWRPERHLDRATLPTPGQMVEALNAAAQGRTADAVAAAQLDAHYEHGVRHDLYG